MWKMGTKPPKTAAVLFPSRPEPGRYLWAWAERYGLDGEGFAPTSMAGHHFMTLAALDALPEVRAWLGDEAELLTWAYCGFPDMNWHTYGRFNVGSKDLAHIRLPDTRREWEISRYCGWNDLTKKGVWISHGPEAFVRHYARACSAARRGRSWDAARILGAALHCLQDSGSPPHTLGIGGPLHRPAENLRDPEAIRIPEYLPRAKFDPEAAAQRLVRLSKPRARKILRLLKADVDADALALQLECAIPCAKATADALADFHRRFADTIRFRPRPARKNVELLRNGDFAVPDDETFCPAGWAMKWWDRTEKSVRIERQRTRGGWCVAASHVGARVACMTTWPRAVRVRPGDVYRFAGRVSAPGAGSCGLYAEVYDGATRKLCEWEFAASGSGRWRSVEGEICVGEGARILRAGVFAERTAGPARFTSLSLVRTD